MRYFPILEELFTADTWVFFWAGACGAFAAGLFMRRHRLQFAVVCLLGYAACEAALTLCRSYAWQFFVLFSGTALLGMCPGALAAYALKRLCKK